jgi:hypothetical protein
MVHAKRALCTPGYIQRLNKPRALLGEEHEFYSELKSSPQPSFEDTEAQFSV